MQTARQLREEFELECQRDHLPSYERMLGRPLSPEEQVAMTVNLFNVWSLGYLKGGQDTLAHVTTLLRRKESVQ